MRGTEPKARKICAHRSQPEMAGEELICGRIRGTFSWVGEGLCR